MVAYELWETESGNLIDTFPTEEEALADVRATITEFGRESVVTYALAHETRRRTKLIAQGDALVARALAGASATESTAPPVPPRAAVNV
ncbi:MAG: hypothetical protein ACRDI2_04625 [Chloroflexota bacterium]